MGQKHPGVTVNRLELTCHKLILPATTLEIRDTQICNSPPGVAELQAEREFPPVKNDLLDGWVA
jgi:hypothetical protein